LISFQASAFSPEGNESRVAESKNYVLQIQVDEHDQRLQAATLSPPEVDISDLVDAVISVRKGTSIQESPSILCPLCPCDEFVAMWK